MFGSTWRQRIAPSPAPSACAAVTNSWTRSARTFARVSRANTGTYAMPTATMLMSTPGRKTAAIRSAESTAGNP